MDKQKSALILLMHGANLKIELRLKEIVWKGMRYFDLAHGRDKFWDFVNTVMNSQGPIICGEFLELLKKFQPQKKYELLQQVSSCFKIFGDEVLNTYVV